MGSFNVLLKGLSADSVNFSILASLEQLINNAAKKNTVSLIFIIVGFSFSVNVNLCETNDTNVGLAQISKLYFQL